MRYETVMHSPRRRCPNCRIYHRAWTRWCEDCFRMVVKTSVGWLVGAVLSYFVRGHFQ